MIREVFGIGSPTEERSLSFQDVFGQALDVTGYGGTKAGKRVTQEGSLAVSAVYGSVRILSDGVSTLPLDPYIRWNGTRKPYVPPPSWLSFSQGPLRKSQLLGQVMVSLLLDGNAFIATYRDLNGSVVFMDVLDPSNVTVSLNPKKQPIYTIANKPFTAFDILHIPGLTLPGEQRGVSPIKAAEETIGLSMAATEFGAAFFGNGALPGMTAEIPGELSNTGIKRLKRAWNDAHQGSGNAHRLAVLTEGAKFSKVTINPDEAQFLETRAFQIPDIARIYGVPPHLLADASNSTSWGSGLQEQNTAFVQHSLLPWVERIEAAFTWLMHSEGHSTSSFVKLDVNGLLRGDATRRMEVYSKGIQSGIYSVNEVRALEDLPPIEGGDIHLSPLNLSDIKNADNHTGQQAPQPNNP